jgi:pyrroloquinoline-quinone synthase
VTAPLIERLDARIEAKSLLGHSFYQAWQAGELSLDDLRLYAAQYYHFEANFPTILSAIHSRCDDPSVRQTILSNLWDEEHGSRNHPALWLEFAGALGLSAEDVRGVDLLPETAALVDTLQDIAENGTYQEGLAAVYAYERQLPAVAETKVLGLKEFYGLDSLAAIEFFALHEEIDLIHSAAEADVLTNTTSDELAVEQAAQRALDAWWGFLDGVERVRNARN